MAISRGRPARAETRILALRYRVSSVPAGIGPCPSPKAGPYELIVCSLPASAHGGCRRR